MATHGLLFFFWLSACPESGPCDAPCPPRPAPLRPSFPRRDFWPHYLDDHTDVTNQRLHFVGTSVAFVLMLLNPGSFVALGLALSLGFAICPLGRALDTGFVEFGIVLAVFIALAKVRLPRLKREAHPGPLLTTRHRCGGRAGAGGGGHTTRLPPPPL